MTSVWLATNPSCRRRLRPPTRPARPAQPSVLPADLLPYRTTRPVVRNVSAATGAARPGFPRFPSSIRTLAWGTTSVWPATSRPSRHSPPEHPRRRLCQRRPRRRRTPVPQATQLLQLRRPNHPSRRHRRQQPPRQPRVVHRACRRTMWVARPARLAMRRASVPSCRRITLVGRTIPARCVTRVRRRVPL